MALHLQDEMANREEMEMALALGEGSERASDLSELSRASDTAVLKSVPRNLSEIREVTCVFINLKGLQLASSDAEGAARRQSES